VSVRYLKKDEVINKYNKNQKDGIVLFKGFKDCPRIVYNYVDSPESIQKMNRAYDILFESVLKSQNWKDRKKRSISVK